MMRLLASLLFVPALALFQLHVTAQVSYRATCEVRDGKAYGYMENHRDAAEVDGNVWFHFFDCSGRIIGSDDEYEYEYVSAGSREEIETTSVPNGTCSCEFILQDAITNSNVRHPGNPNCHQNGYRTHCTVRNGTAFGDLTNYGEAMEVDGTVWFQFYDCEGRFIGSEDDHEYEYVSSRSTEEIETTTVPSGTCSCTFDVQGALKR